MDYDQTERPPSEGSWEYLIFVTELPSHLGRLFYDTPKKTQYLSHHFIMTKSKKISYCYYFILCSFAGPTDVKVSILIRSMGPISDIDMVMLHLVMQYHY